MFISRELCPKTAICMTKGSTVVMAFMMKKKKYKFQVDVCLEELLEVPFVSAVLFAKVRLLDGGNFQDHSSREEVREHSVKWGARFSFPCKMTANASTGVLEPCILRVSVRKESKGGRSFHKLGFVDLNLAEFAGAGLATRRYLLEGYDARHRQDNSMLRLSIKMNMLSGDILFKVPSPSLNHKPVPADQDQAVDQTHDFSSGSLAGSIASGSSGFGSLPKKRPNLLTSELLTGQSVIDNCTGNPQDTTVTVLDLQPNPLAPDAEENHGELGHSRNSSNTSQMSKASGYSSVHSHSRQSSSGDSGHIRSLHRQKWCHINPQQTFSPLSPSLTLMNPQRNKFWHSRSNGSIGGTTPTKGAKNNNSINSEKALFKTPKGLIIDTASPGNAVDKNHLSISDFGSNSSTITNGDVSGVYITPHLSNVSSASSFEDYRTPEGTMVPNGFVFPKNSTLSKQQDSLSTISETCDGSGCNKKSPNKTVLVNHLRHSAGATAASSVQNGTGAKSHEGVLRSKSEFEIPKHAPSPVKLQKSDSNGFFGFLTPLTLRRAQNGKNMGVQSTPKKHSPPGSGVFKVPGSPVLKNIQNSRTTSLNSLRSGEALQPSAVIQRGMPHRKLFEGSSGGKLAPVAISPDELPMTSVQASSTSDTQTPVIRRPSVTMNPSSSSLVLSETGSLDRAKAAFERRKKAQGLESEVDRVEITRVNPAHLITELLKNTNLEPADDSAESSGLQLFIAKDGTAAVGSREVKSQMSTGVQLFKQVVMEDKR